MALAGELSQLLGVFLLEAAALEYKITYLSTALNLMRIGRLYIGLSHRSPWHRAAAAYSREIQHARLCRSSRYDQPTTLYTILAVFTLASRSAKGTK